LGLKGPTSHAKVLIAFIALGLRKHKFWSLRPCCSEELQISDTVQKMNHTDNSRSINHKRKKIKN
jgi:hypothetical protein